MSETIDTRIREVLGDHAKLQVPAGELSDQDDLYRVGLTSHASVNVMLALESVFDVEFSDEMLRKSTFQSISSIRDALAQTGVDTA